MLRMSVKLTRVTRVVLPNTLSDIHLRKKTSSSGAHDALATQHYLILHTDIAATDRLLLMHPQSIRHPVIVHHTRWTSILRSKWSLGRPVASMGQPEPSRGRSLGSRSRGRFDWSPFTWRPRDVQSVLHFSQSECGPSATRPWQFTDRKLVVLRPSETWISLSYTHHGAEVSANQNAALVQLTITPYGQKVGCPQVASFTSGRISFLCDSLAWLALLLFCLGDLVSPSFIRLGDLVSPMFLSWPFCSVLLPGKPPCWCTCMRVLLTRCGSPCKAPLACFCLRVSLAGFGLLAIS